MISNRPPGVSGRGGSVASNYMSVTDEELMYLAEKYETPSHST